MKKKRFDTPIVIFLVGIIIFIIALVSHYYYAPNGVPLPIAFGILGVFAVCAIVTLIWNTIRINMKIKATSNNGTQNIPNIDWNKVQELLNEEK